MTLVERDDALATLRGLLDGARRARAAAAAHRLGISPAQS
jgi:hypothetical protein